MSTEIALGLSCCVAVSLVALGYGEYTTGRQLDGRPVVGLERVHNLLFLFAINVSVIVMVAMVWTQLPLSFVFSVLLGVVPVVLAPIVLWYLFVLPLRLTRRLSHPRRSGHTTPHPLDAAWPANSSFLDDIKARRTQTPETFAHHPSADRPAG